MWIKFWPLVPAALGHIPSHSAVWVPRPWFGFASNCSRRLAKMSNIYWSQKISAVHCENLDFVTVTVVKKIHRGQATVFNRAKYIWACLPPNIGWNISTRDRTESAAVSTIPDGLSCIKHFWSPPLTCELCLHACLGNWLGCLLVNSLPCCGFTCRWKCP